MVCGWTFSCSKYIQLPTRPLQPRARASGASRVHMDSLATEMPSEWPMGYCQLCITHPAYATPLLSVSARKEQLTGIVARWSHAENLKLLRAIPTPPVSKELYHVLTYTIPPKTELNFLGELRREEFDDIQGQKVIIAFNFTPLVPCSECHSPAPFEEILPKPECAICQDRPSYHHTHCCPCRNFNLSTKDTAALQALHG